MIKYEVYKYENDEAVLVETIEADEDDIDTMKRVAKLHKDSKTYVQPLSEDGIWPMVRPQRRGKAKLSDKHVVKIFRLRAEEALSSYVIGARLSSEDEVVVSAESIDNVLKRKTYADVDIPQEFLDEIEGRKVKRQKRHSITPEHKREMLELHDGGRGLSGREISRLPQYPYSSDVINRMFRNELGFMEPNGLRHKYNKNK